MGAHDVDTGHVCEKLTAEFLRLLDDPSGRWNVECTRSELGLYEVSATHPASSGVVIEVEPGTLDRMLEQLRSLVAVNADEFRIAGAAPDELPHRDVLLAVRTFVTAFSWSNHEVRAVAGLLHEIDAITDEEAAWLRTHVGGA